MKTTEDVGPRRCWKLRLLDDDQARQPWINSQLLAEGNLHFGWGYEGCDLRGLKRRSDSGEILTGTEGLAWKKAGRLLEIQEGDLVFTPNVPEDRHFGVFEVKGEYRFDPDAATSDYRGHEIPVTTRIPIVNKWNEAVSAQVVGSTFNQGAITRMGAPWDHILRLLRAASIEDFELESPSSEVENMAKIVSSAADSVATRLAESFSGKQLEVPVRRLMETIYLGGDNGSVEYSQALDNSGIDVLVTAGSDCVHWPRSDRLKWPHPSTGSLCFSV